MKVLFHIHAHLTIFIDGNAVVIPYGVGIAPPIMGMKTTAGFFLMAGSCISWLHTHAADGIIHIESPVERTYTLGEFFDIWGQPLTGGRVGSVRGHVTAFFDGKYWDGDPRQIPLLRHAQIQLDIGTPLIAPESITFHKPL